MRTLVLSMLAGLLVLGTATTARASARPVTSARHGALELRLGDAGSGQVLIAVVDREGNLLPASHLALVLRLQVAGQPPVTLRLAPAGDGVHLLARLAALPAGALMAQVIGSAQGAPFAVNLGAVQLSRPSAADPTPAARAAVLLAHTPVAAGGPRLLEQSAPPVVVADGFYVVKGKGKKGKLKWVKVKAH